MLNKIVLGAAQLGMNYGINNYGILSRKEVFEILSFANDRGINFIDTAEVYGKSLELIGLYFKKNPNNNFKVISKLNTKFNFKIENFNDHIQNQLKIVGRGSFYGYMFHSYSSFIKNRELFHKFQDLKNQGVIENIGISLYETNNIVDIIKNYNFDFIQIPFNLLDNEKDKTSILNIAKEKQIKVHVRSIFLQGLFFKPFDDYNRKTEPLKKYIKKLVEISLESETDIQHLALKYPLKKDYIDKVIFGVHNLKQLSQNIEIIKSDVEVPVDKIETINVEEKELLKPYNWK